MQRAPIDGVGLEYEVRGDGEPVVLMHGGVCADFFAPLMNQPRLRGDRLPDPLPPGRVLGQRPRGRRRRASACRPRTAWV